MIGISALAAGLILTSNCPSFPVPDRDKEQIAETETWLRNYASTSWGHLSTSEQRFRFSVTGTPLQEFGYEMRGWRTVKGWRIFVRKLDAPSPYHPLRHFGWRERRVDSRAATKIDAIWSNDCLWSTPRLRLAAPRGGGKYVWKKLTAPEWISNGQVDYDLERPGQKWLGEQGQFFAAGLPAEFSTLILSLGISTN